MNILYSSDKKNFISYYISFGEKNKAPYVIFLHGFMSNMQGEKAAYLEKLCAKRQYNFIKFDNFGCGNSSGDFLDQTITSWGEGLDLVINNLVPKDRKIILIGSSAGAWNALLAAEKYKEKVVGMIGVSSAFDFTERLIWQNLSPAKQNELMTQGRINMQGDDQDCDSSYPISYNLILDAKKYLCSKKLEIDAICPVVFIHGMNDHHVPYHIMLEVVPKIKSNSLEIHLIKDGQHKLSRNEDLELLSFSLERMIAKLDS